MVRVRYEYACTILLTPIGVLVFLFIIILVSESIIQHNLGKSETSSVPQPFGPGVSVQ